jgi:hypothetical protein
MILSSFVLFVAFVVGYSVPSAESAINYTNSVRRY